MQAHTDTAVHHCSCMTSTIPKNADGGSRARLRQDGTMGSEGGGNECAWGAPAPPWKSGRTSRIAGRPPSGSPPGPAASPAVSGMADDTDMDGCSLTTRMSCQARRMQKLAHAVGGTFQHQVVGQDGADRSVSDENYGCGPARGDMQLHKWKRKGVGMAPTTSMVGLHILSASGTVSSAV